MKNNIIFLDCTVDYGYGYGAGNTKVEFLVRGLNENGDKCIVHNGIVGYAGVKKDEKIFLSDACTIITYKKHGGQVFSWLFNLLKLFRDLKKYYLPNYNNIIINDNCDYHLFLIYLIYAKIIGYKWVSLSHEWLPTINNRAPRKQLDWLYAKTFGFFTSAILPVSEYIIKKTKHFKKPFLKVPILADFSICPMKIEKEPFFLYCVSANYYRVILPLIEAHNIYRDKYNGINKLLLVLGGTDSNYKKILRYINENKLDTYVITKRQIPYSELLDLYRKAKALLIPLDPNSEQDYARFSQKIAEYLSVGSPIISTNVGEIPYYFKDKENIIISEYTKDGFAKSMKWVDNNPEKTTMIGLAGYNLGKENFNYITCGKNLHDFLLSIY